MDIINSMYEQIKGLCDKGYVTVNFDENDNEYFKKICLALTANEASFNSFVPWTMPFVALCYASQTLQLRSKIKFNKGFARKLRDKFNGKIREDDGKFYFGGLDE